MDQSLMDERLSKRNKRLGALLGVVFVVLFVASTILLMASMQGR